MRSEVWKLFPGVTLPRRPAPAPMPRPAVPARPCGDALKLTGGSAPVRPQSSTSATDEGYIRLLYQTFLGREADPAGLAAHLEALTKGWTTREDLAIDFATCPEYQHRQQVIGLYRGLLGREPDAEGYKTHMADLTAGKPLHEIQKRFLESAEYLGGPGHGEGRIPDESYLRSLYWGVLGRDPDPAGFRSHLEALKNGTTSRQRLRQDFLSCPEYQATLPPPPPPPAPPAPAGPGKVPYISQLTPADDDRSYYNGPNNCGPATVAMIARAFGYGGHLTDADLVNHLGRIGGTAQAGTNINGIAAMGRAIGKSASTAGPRANVGWIADQLRAGKLVAANGNYYAMSPHRDSNAVAQGRGGHYVAVIGQDAHGNFLVHDPMWNRGGAPGVYTPAELAEFINANSNGGWQIAIG